MEGYISSLPHPQSALYDPLAPSVRPWKTHQQYTALYKFRLQQEYFMFPHYNQYNQRGLRMPELTDLQDFPTNKKAHQYNHADFC